MNDTLRYRVNAAECLSGAERCEPPYRHLTLAIAFSWLSWHAIRKPWTNFSRIGARSQRIIRIDGRRTMKACILALMLGFALAGTGLVLNRQLPLAAATCIDGGC
jgi:hypothetical protein